MDAIMLEGWTPILLIGIVSAIIFFFLSRKISRKALFLTSTVFSLICVGVVIYSKDVVGGWEGIGLGTVTFIVFIGIWLGTIVGAIRRSRK
ncbi:MULTISPECIES: YesK-like family protein [Oceanobacillus]|uniref:YesK-like family protein n=1 Tax=Oceanobacillus TaxID=182709 RepID=UPI0009855CDD|nr:MULTISPECIES: YesK-like family protein [Oceanobacillus]MBT2599367.1 YesK-like family protein [Oceanobacillus sp. ISL-74]MBT2652285.1 YesK-like family protein [Oceanobacillus sp. ISL-73]